MSYKINFRLFSKLVRIRKIEEFIAKKYSEFKMRCPVHLSIGQEAIPVGICSNLKKSDQLFSAHRSHAHYLAKGGNLKKMISELYGKKNGCVSGKGGSMHLLDLEVGVLGAVPIVGSTIPIATGAAWANKIKKNNKIVVVFFGDGATEEGVFMESLDFASLKNLPILYVCENNKYSVYSRINSRQSSKRKITNISKSLGIKSKKIPGNDTIKIFKETRKIINQIRKGAGPRLIELNTYRTLEHCGPNNDDHLNYRPIKEINLWKKNCPIKKLRNDLNKNAKFKRDEFKNNSIILKELKTAFKHAERSLPPKKADLFKNIYV